MELAFKRTLILLMLVAAFLIAGLALTNAGPGMSLGGAAVAGENGDGGGEPTSTPGDGGGAPSGGVETGGGGTAGSSDGPVWPIALGGLAALAGGSLLIRRIAKDNG